MNYIVKLTTFLLQNYIVKLTTFLLQYNELYCEVDNLFIAV